MDMLGKVSNGNVNRILQHSQSLAKLRCACILDICCAHPIQNSAFSSIDVYHSIFT